MAVYYIGTAAHGASDDNPGTQGEPFASFDAVPDLEPGDTVYFREGTYQNSTYQSLTEERDAAGDIVNGADGQPNMVRDIWKGGSDKIISLNDVHGDRENPITIAAEPGAAVKLQFDADSAIGLRDSSYINIEGFEIEGAGASFGSDADARDAALDAQFSYRIETGEDANGKTYTYHNRLDDRVDKDGDGVIDVIDADGDINLTDLGDVEKPGLFNSAAISLPLDSHDINITNNVIHHSAAHAVSGHGGNDRITVSGNEVYENNHYTSAGTHAISFKGLENQSNGESGVPSDHQITITDNYVHDNYNLMVSWSAIKEFIAFHIDEGKGIHIQNAYPIGGDNDRNWTGDILIANNLVVNTGNVAITINGAQGVDILNNTIVDAGYVNQLIVQNGDADSDLFGFFTDQYGSLAVPAAFLADLVGALGVSSGGLNISDSLGIQANDITVSNNLISISDDSLFVLNLRGDAVAEFNNNIYSGGAGDRGDGGGGFIEVDDIGFVDAANGDYHLTQNSAAVDAGVATPTITTDLDDTARSDGHLDIGAFEADTSDLTPREIYEQRQANEALANDGTVLPDFTTEQAIGTLDNASNWDQAIVTYSFPVVDGLVGEHLDYLNNSRHGTLHTFTAEQAAAGRLGIEMWDDLITTSFVDAGNDADADTRFFNSTINSTAGGAPAGEGTAGDIWIYDYNDQGNNDPAQVGRWGVGEFAFSEWILHEIGHTLGLSHPIPGSASTQDYIQDSDVYTVMTYVTANETGVNWPDYGGSPMINDIAAVQSVYGADLTTRTGDDTYGFNSTVADRLPFDFDAMQDAGIPLAPIAIWDAGGIDTIDFSGFGVDTVIDLAEGGFSNVGTIEAAIGIAYDAEIENATGGHGNDSQFGNALDNVLRGGEGNDVLRGGAGNDTLYGEGVTVRDAPEDFNLVELDRSEGESTFVQNVSAFPTGSFTVEFLWQQGDLTDEAYSFNFPGFSIFRYDNGTSGIRFGEASESTWSPGLPPVAFTDGDLHRISLSYDDASGEFLVYVDGVWAGGRTFTPGTRGNNANGLIDETGTIEIRDNGNFGDLRIFDSALGADDILSRWDRSLTDPANEAGLVQYWTADDAGNLTSALAGGTDFTNASPLTSTNGALWVPTFDDTLLGGLGDDHLTGGAGNDTQHGGDGDDFVRGNAGDDFLYGDAGIDTLRGDAGADEMHGGDDRDTLSGLDDNDTLFGDAGDDKLYGGRGDDEIHGGDDNDYARGDIGNDTMHGDAGRDTMRGDAGDDQLHGGDDNDRLSGNDGIDYLYGEAGDDKLWGDAGDDHLFGGDGADYLRGYGDNDIIYGGSGNDVIGGEDGDDELHGGGGFDLIFARDGIDTVFGDGGNDTIYGGLQGDTLNGGANNDFLRGEEGDDTLNGDDGDDILRGDEGSDTLNGGAGVDTLSGNTGADFLNGGAGNDRLYGNADTDTFIFTDGFGDDTIFDFANDGLEKIDLSGVTNITDFADLTANHLSEVGGNAVIDDGANTITIRNVAEADIDASDFLF